MILFIIDVVKLKLFICKVCINIFSCWLKVSVVVIFICLGKILWVVVVDMLMFE